ncbi:MAG: hypothetical protein R3F35_21580 [Myxococcota bacterium]
MLRAERHAYPDYGSLLEDYYERGWTDGLPVVPPTPERVEAFLGAAGLAPDLVLGAVPTRDVVVTAEHAAINAVMAGCRPEYFPTVVAAVRAHLHEKANCHSTTGTLSGASQIVVVNGPVRDEIGIECRGACFGPGFRANATIGRALRLVIRNVCRAVPGVFDRASLSTPFRYSFCFGEDEEANDWLPLHVERGLAPEQSAVTVHSTMVVWEVMDYVSRTPEAIADAWLVEILRKGVYADRFVAEANLLIAVSAEHQRRFAEAGWSKADVRGYLWERCQASSEAKRIMLAGPEGFLVVGAGGPGHATTWLFFPHLARAITQAIEPRRR